MPLHDPPCMWPQEGCRCPPDELSQAEHDFVHWLAIAQTGQERPYPDAIADLVSRAAAAGLVARGRNQRMGLYVVRLSYRPEEGLKL